MNSRAERCLAKRFPGFGCTACQEACPRGMASAGEPPPDCDDCGLCTRACPSGALKPSAPITLPARWEKGRLRLGCPHAEGGPCLAAVPDWVYLTAALAAPAGVRLATDGCSACPVGGGPRLARRVEVLNDLLQRFGRRPALSLGPAAGPLPERFSGWGGSPGRREFLRSLAPVLGYISHQPGRIWAELGTVDGEFPHAELDRGGYLRLNAEKCIGCGLCTLVCPVQALRTEEGRLLQNASECRHCGLCVQTCPGGALELLPAIPLAELARGWRPLGEVGEPICRRCGRRHPLAESCGKEREYLRVDLEDPA